MNFNNLADEPIFATDRRGFKIYCDDEQMDYIYNYHPELRNFWATEADIKAAIQDAQVIYQSTHGSEYNIYYLRKRNKNTELKVVVKFNEGVGIIWAVQPISNRKPGEIIIWPNMNP